MYQPPHFQADDVGALHALLREHPLGLLVTPGADGLPVVDAVPFLLALGEHSPDAPQGTLVGHVARANPLWQAAAGRPVTVVFKGPDAYISPNWYASKAEHGKVVPTWNYTVVQARGLLQVQDDPAAARAVVEALTTAHESRNARPWALDDAPPDYVAATLRAIVAIRIPLQSLQGKFKLSQNRSAADHAGVVAGLQAAAGVAGTPGDAAAVARWMSGRAGRAG